MRRSTRVSWRVRVRLSGVDGNHPFTEDCETVIVNLHGCALQCPRVLRPGSAVQLEIGSRLLNGRVMDAVPMGEPQGRWMLGIALDQAGNHWGIQYPPEDWGTPPPAQLSTASSDPPQAKPDPVPGKTTAVNPNLKTTIVASAAPRPEAPKPILATAASPPEQAPVAPPIAPAPRPAVPPPGASLEQLRAQLRELQEAQARQEAMLLQERDERQSTRADANQAMAANLERVRQAKEYVESLVCSFPSMVEAQAQEILRRFQSQARRTGSERPPREGQQAAEAALEQRSAQLADDLRRQLEQMFQERRQAFDSACAAAASEMQHSQLMQRQSEFNRELEPLLHQAANAASELRLTLKSVQQEHRMNEAATVRLRHQAEEVQAWLNKETEKFQQGLRDAFIDAGGEIRGRIAQAVETAAEPIEACSREVQQQLASLAERHVKELHHHADVVCERMECSSEESQAAVASALQARLAQALAGFTQDAQRLTEESMERWQAAVTETLSAIPKLLADHFAGQR